MERKSITTIIKEQTIGKKQLIIRAFLLSVFDIIIAFAAIYFALVLRFNSFQISQYYDEVLIFGIILSGLLILTYSILGLYKSLWKYASVEELAKLIFSSFIAIVVLFFISMMMGHRLPNSIYPIAFLIQVGLSGGMRFAYRILRALKLIVKSRTISHDDPHKVIVIGGGYDAVATIKAYAEGKRKGAVVALIDRHNTKGTLINNIMVHGGLDKLEDTIIRYDADEVIIASETFTGEDVDKTLDVCSRTGCRLRKYTAVSDLNQSNMIVDIDPKDLLGRPQVQLDQMEMNTFLGGKTILVTGGGGSIGSELVKQMAEFKPDRIVIFDIYENCAYLTKLAVERNFPDVIVDVEIGSIRDRDRIVCLFEKYRPNIVFHAAAHKHVPLMEKSPGEALKNNVLGTYNVAKAAHKHKADTFVLISTDKAVNPTNIMGATKRMAEIIVKAIDSESETEFSAVRFGNVLGSSGSVIPIFKQQIEEGGPVRVTHPEITRYFMTISEACQLVLQAGAYSKGGEIFILDMNKPITIRELAEKMIKMHGLTPNVDIMIEYSGLRPGEKLYEELLVDENAGKTSHDKIFIESAKAYSLYEIDNFISRLRNESCKKMTIHNVQAILREFVPEYVEQDIQKINNKITVN